MARLSRSSDAADAARDEISQLTALAADADEHAVGPSGPSGAGRHDALSQLPPPMVAQGGRQREPIGFSSGRNLDWQQREMSPCPQGDMQTLVQPTPVRCTPTNGSPTADEPSVSPPRDAGGGMLGFLTGRGFRTLSEHQEEVLKVRNAQVPSSSHAAELEHRGELEA